MLDIEEVVLREMRLAARVWEEDFAEKLQTLGVRSAGRLLRCSWDAGYRTRALVHTDDFVVAGLKEGVDRVQRSMHTLYEARFARYSVGTPTTVRISSCWVGRYAWRRKGSCWRPSRHGVLTKKEMGIECAGTRASGYRGEVWQFRDV